MIRAVRCSRLPLRGSYVVLRRLEATSRFDLRPEDRRASMARKELVQIGSSQSNDENNEYVPDDVSPGGINV